MKITINQLAAITQASALLKQNNLQEATPDQMRLVFKTEDAASGNAARQRDICKAICLAIRTLHELGKELSDLPPVEIEISKGK